MRRSHTRERLDSNCHTTRVSETEQNASTKERKECGWCGLQMAALANGQERQAGGSRAQESDNDPPRVLACKHKSCQCFSNYYKSDVSPSVCNTTESFCSCVCCYPPCRQLCCHSWDRKKWQRQTRPHCCMRVMLTGSMNMSHSKSI